MALVREVRRVEMPRGQIVLRDLKAPDGGFAAAVDADSEGEEGRFYLWTADEIAAVLGPAAAEEFGAAFHVEAHGNFTSETGERSGRNILHRLSPLALAASDYTLAADGLPAPLEASRLALFAAREGRVRPLRDDKVLADWIGLTIAALAKAGALLGEARYVAEAEAAAAFVLTRMRDARGEALPSRPRPQETAMSASGESNTGESSLSRTNATQAGALSSLLPSLLLSGLLFPVCGLPKRKIPDMPVRRWRACRSELDSTP